MIPLPLAFGAPLLTARIRTTPDDFQVDELPAFEATGEGEHLLLHIRKRGANTVHVAKLLAEDAAMIRNTDRYAWASHYLQEMSKAVIDDVVKVLESPGNNL